MPSRSLGVILRKERRSDVNPQHVARFESSPSLRTRSDSSHQSKRDLLVFVFLLPSRLLLLFVKEFDHKREQKAYLLTNAYRDEEDDENDRQRRQEIIRQTHQIQREIGHQVGTIEKFNERKKQEYEKKQNSPNNSKPVHLLLSSMSLAVLALNQPPRALSPTSAAERAFRIAALMEKYSSKRQNSTAKPH